MTGSLQAASVFSRTFGRGQRSVFAVHCSLAHSGAWRGLAKQLENEATFACFDLLSHGQSPDWDGSGDYQDQNVEAGLSLLDGPADLIGHSFGATVALRIALARPDLVRSLTLIEPVLFAVAIADGSAAVDRMEADQLPFRTALEAGNIELAARLFNRLWGPGDPKWPDLSAAAREGMIRAIHIIPASRATLYEDRPGVLKPGVLQQLDVPVLLLQGEKTHPVITDVCQGLLRRLPQAQGACQEGSGHMVPVTHPSQTAEHLRQFWSTGSEAAAPTAVGGEEVS